MNLIVLGQQGSGKGVQADFLSQRFDLVHIDMGEFLREVAKSDTPLGREVYEIQNVTKTLVPSRILKEVFQVKLNSIPREQGIVFDGFPRNLDQAQYLEGAMKDFGRKIDQVIFINIPEEETIERISKRIICERCKERLILGKDIESQEIPCPACGGKVTQRTDDTPEGIKKRLKVFYDETAPVIEFYGQRNLLSEIKGDQPIEKVSQDILEVLIKKKIIDEC